MFLSRFDQRRNMWSSIIMQENNSVMPGVVMGAFFLECSAQSHQLCSVESPSNGLVRFEQLIIHDTKLIPPNTQHEFFSMNIRLSCRCWSRPGDPHDFLFFGWIVGGSIFHHQWLCDAKNLFVYAWHFTCEKSTFNVLGFSSYGPNSLAFESFPMISNDMKLFVESFLM